MSSGCDNCYAETIAHRFAGTPAYPDGFAVTLRPERLELPQWTRPRLVFVNSMSDLFHGDVPPEYVRQVFDVMARADRHTFQVLTKRPGRMRSLLTVWGQDGWTPPPNVWLGVSAEDQKTADLRIPVLMETPAAVRFVSAEPLLGPLRLNRLHSVCPVHDFDGGFCTGPCPHVRIPDWVIVGGESGPHARPMDEVDALNLWHDCQAAGIPFLFKQWGEHDADGVRVGKKAAGRVFRGQTWDEYPRGFVR